MRARNHVTYPHRARSRDTEIIGQTSSTKLKDNKRYFPCGNSVLTSRCHVSFCILLQSRFKLFLNNASGQINDIFIKYSPVVSS